MKRSLYLVRHGEVFNPNHIVYGDLPGFHLSPRGVQEVHRTGVHLSGVSMDRILSSPLERARETSCAIASHHQVVPSVDARLTESGQFPHWTGHRWESIPEHFPGELERYLEDASSVGANEQLSNVVERYLAVVHEAVAKGAAAFAIVGHQDPVQATRLALTGRPLGELRQDPPQHGEVITLTTTGGGQWSEASRWSPTDPTC